MLDEELRRRSVEKSGEFGFSAVVFEVEDTGFRLVRGSERDERWMFDTLAGFRLVIQGREKERRFFGLFNWFSRLVATTNGLEIQK